MEWLLFFEILIVVTIVVLMLFVLKAFFAIVLLKKTYQNRFNYLKNKLHIETEKSKSIHQKTILINSLNKSLYNRVFKIIETFFLFQKLMFEERDN